MQEMILIFQWIQRMKSLFKGLEYNNRYFWLTLLEYQITFIKLN